MKIIVINGSMRKGSTYHFAHMVINQLKTYQSIELTEYFLPKDLPNFCMGCYSCIFKGEEKCPHANYTSILQKDMEESDLIILTSPGYVFDVSGQMKSFLDHFAFQWMSHRPNPQMFHKMGLGVVTAAGAGMTPALKTITRNLNWWGIGKVFGMSQAVMAASFNEIPEKIKLKMEKKAHQTVKIIHKTYQLKNKIKPSFTTRFLFNIMKLGKSGHPEWNQVDYDFWKKSGYLNGIKPWNC